MTAGYQGSIDAGGGALTSAGGSDILLVHFANTGSHMFSNRFGDGSDQTAGAITVDAQNQVIVCGTAKDSIDFGSNPLTSSGNSNEVSNNSQW